MKKIIIIACLLIFLTACGSGGIRQGSGSGTPDGLHITFLEFQPRSELRENEIFDVGLRLENRAECDIIGEVCVRDTLAESISGIQDDCQAFELRKKEDGIIDSEKIYFTDNVYESVTADLSTNVMAKAEYSCSIQLTPQICVKPNLEDDNICKTKETIGGSTFGLKSAPITVTSIEKILIPQRGEDVKLNLEIKFKKMTEGKADSFKIRVEYEGYGELSCRGIDKLNFEDDKTNQNTENVINCEIPLNVDDVEENPLKITLNYIYETSKTKPIKILKEGDEL